MAAKTFQSISEIIQFVIAKITDDSDVIYAGFSNPAQVRTEIENDLPEIEKGNTTILAKYNLWFAPTGPLQEISLSNNWGKEYLMLAEQFDKLYKKVKR